MEYTRNRDRKQFYINFYDVEIVARYEQNSPHQGADWLPPTSRDDFHIAAETGWLFWNGEKLVAEPETLAQPSNIYTCSESTLFWCPQRGAFLQVPYDCLAREVWRCQKYDPHLGWLPITFQRPEKEIEKNYPNLWLVGTNLQDEYIPLPMSRSIGDLLAPGYFKNGENVVNPSDTCDLAGKLSLLYGLVAMTSPFENLPHMFERSLRLQADNSYVFVPTWERGLPPAAGRSRHRGLVVKVGYKLGYHNQEDVKRYECGGEGPIIRSQSSNEPGRFTPSQQTFGAHPTFRHSHGYN